MGERCGRSACMVIVLTEGVPDGCPDGTLTGACCGWSTCTAMSLTEGACFLTSEGVSPWESTVSASSTTAGSQYLRLFWPAVVPRGSSLRSASRAAADIIRMTRKRIKLSQNRKLSRVNLISCACDLAFRFASFSSLLVSLLCSYFHLINWSLATLAACRLCIFKVLAMLGSRYRKLSNWLAGSLDVFYT